MMEREKDVAFDALAAMPKAFLRLSACLPIAGFFTAAFASASAAFAARLACRSARTLSAASSASVFGGDTSGVDFAFRVIMYSVIVP
jgi:hypothetical protein